MKTETKINIRLSKIFENSLSGFIIAIAMCAFGAALATIWTAVTEQPDNIDNAVQQVEAKLTAIIDMQIEQMELDSIETKVLRDELDRLHAEVLSLHSDKGVHMVLPVMPEQKTFNASEYKEAINIKQQQYYQQKK